jgi:hypothetical protein
MKPTGHNQFVKVAVDGELLGLPALKGWTAFSLGGQAHLLYVFHKGHLKVLVHFCKTTRRLMPEDEDLLTHHHENLSSAIFMIIAPMETALR